MSPRWVTNSKVHEQLCTFKKDYDILHAPKQVSRARTIVDMYKPQSLMTPDELEELGLRTSRGTQHPGDTIIEDLEVFLDQFHRSFHQKLFQRAFLSACLRQIYGDEFQQHRHRVMAKFKFKNAKQQCLVSLPRRYGKTWGTALFIAAFSLHVSGQEVSIFSPSKRQSVMLLDTIYDFLVKFNVTDRIMRRTEEKMVLKSLDGKTTKINSYPASTKTLRGVSATIIVVDELAFLDPAVLNQVIIPVFQLDATVLLGISTLGSDENFLSKYIEMKDQNNTALFYCLQVFKSCEKCRETSEEATASCQHNNHVLPSWNSVRKQAIVKAMMDADAFRTELLGIANALYQRAFEKKFVECMFNQEKFMLDNLGGYREFFISIDPNGLGQTSDLGIVSFMKVRGTYVILGIESFPGRTGVENHNVIVSHVRKISEKYAFGSARKVFIVESNLGDTADTYIAMLRDQISNYIVLQDDNAQNKPGTRTTNGIKISAVEFVRECLLESRFQFVTDEDFVSLTRSVGDVKAMFHDQMDEFCEVITDKDFQKNKRVFSGKRSNKKDDIVLSFILGIYWSISFYQKSKYFHFH